MKNLFAALRFLTSIPVPGDCSGDDLAKSVVWFPVVGLLLGLIAALSGWFVFGFFPKLLASISMVFVLMALTGAFHLDGVADCADGFFSSRPRVQVLEIMRDSRVGGMGVLALLFIILFKVAALAEMDWQRACIALFLMPVAGRCLMVVKMAILPYVREEGGIASAFIGNRDGVKTASYVSLAIFYSACWFAAGVNGLIAGALAVLIVGAFATYCKYKIGGITGDTLGAASELAETAMAVGLALAV